MKTQKFDINKLRVASPCSVGWETMTGDDRVRHCNSCKLNIYNFSEMTSGEVQALIEKAEGKICARLFRRADGTVITKDCPVGFRAYQKRVARFAGAALSAIFALFSAGFGQDRSKMDAGACKKSGKIFRSESQNLNYVEGTILDQTCMTVAGATITLINEDTKRETVIKSDKKGYYRALLNAPGRYKYSAEAPGFAPYVNNIEISSHESLQLNVTLNAGVGIIMIEDQNTMIDLKSNGTTRRITREMIDRIPY